MGLQSQIYTRHADIVCAIVDTYFPMRSNFYKTLFAVVILHCAFHFAYILMQADFLLHIFLSAIHNNNKGRPRN